VYYNYYNNLTLDIEPVFFFRRLVFLRSRYLLLVSLTDIYIEVNSLENTFEIEEVVNKEGLTIKKVNGYLLHSKYNPVKEAQQFMDLNFIPEHIHILFGFGSGYIVDAFLKKRNQEKLIVIEPILTEDIYMEEENIILVSTEDNKEIKEAIFSLFNMSHNVKILLSPNYDKICPEIYKDFLTIVNEKLSLEKVNENTLRTMSRQWQENYIMNLQYLGIDDSIVKLDTYTNAPVVIAAGGPSLTKQLPLLKRVRKKIILIAAGSTINTLAAEDIEPDYIISIDGHINNYHHFRDLYFKNATYIYSLYSHFKIRNSFEKKAYYFLSESAKDLNCHLSRISEESIILLKGGGSVAHFAFSFANYISSGPIAMIGQDLAFTNNQTHAENNKHFKKLTDEGLKDKKYIKQKGYYGDEVITDYSFLAMKLSFEQLAQMVENDRGIYNCTEGGIFIKGFENNTFKSFCEEFVQNKETNHYLNKNVENKEKVYLKYKRIYEELTIEMQFYRKMKKHLNDNLTVLSKNKSVVSFDNITLEKLDKNDKKIELYRTKTSLSTSLDPLTLSLAKEFTASIHETPHQKYQRLYKQNIVLYSEMVKIIKETESIVEQLCEKIVVRMENLINE